MQIGKSHFFFLMLMVAERKHISKITAPVRARYLCFPLISNCLSALTHGFSEAGAVSVVSLTLQWLCPSFPPDVPAPGLFPSSFLLLVRAKMFFCWYSSSFSRREDPSTSPVFFAFLTQMSILFLY